jgi:hypothetical protein
MTFAVLPPLRDDPSASRIDSTESGGSRRSGAGERLEDPASGATKRRRRPLLLVAREVTDRVRSVQGGLAEIRQPATLDALSAADFAGLDQVVREQAREDHEYAIVLGRLVYAAARAKGYDRQIVDAALRLDTLLPGDDPGREREKLLRDAYVVAERTGYVEGGRIALNRLGLRALDAGDTERARQTLGLQLALGDEQSDTRPRSTPRLPSAISSGRKATATAPRSSTGGADGVPSASTTTAASPRP